MIWLIVIPSMIFGGTVGALAMAVCAAAGRADEDMDKLYAGTD